MMYRLDTMAFIEKYLVKQDKVPSVEVIKMWEMIVVFCCQTYQQGARGEAFTMPAGIPVTNRESDTVL